MKRRAVLSGLGASLTGTVAGCISFNSGGGCIGETWTAVGYEITLTEINYNPHTETWDGTCELSVNFEFATDETIGITDAGIALYSETGHRTGLIQFGDLQWNDVPEGERTEMDCGDYMRGGLMKEGGFSVSEFPYYLGLWHGGIQAQVSREQHALSYRGDMPPETPVEPNEWGTVIRNDQEPFPPLPRQSPTLGDGVTGGELVSFYRECGPREPTAKDVRCCDVGVTGSFVPANSQYKPALVSATLSNEGADALVEIGVQDYKRPPVTDCETTSLAYTVGLSFANSLPDSIEVIHRGADGEELGRYTITRDT